MKNIKDDDTTFIAETKKDLKHIIDKIKERSEIFGLKLNFEINIIDIIPFLGSRVDKMGISLKIRKLVFPVFTFGWESWNLSKYERKINEKIEISLESQMCEQRITYLEHIIGANGSEKMVILAKIEGRRNRGRPSMI
ncbi:hypothetical protein LAZ67_13001636 [Cordylochernes scorpioides]|uniref:Ribosomal protein S3 n=1 Tax=Cordylochernes scorpioides TaxID=51811 RepID=A0ABY6L408_9ARAC|nr:hypothetical protein LAZ67_13001636 [Cordylochernes scorpioides]